MYVSMGKQERERKLRQAERKLNITSKEVKPTLDQISPVNNKRKNKKGKNVVIYGKAKEVKRLEALQEIGIRTWKRISRAIQEDSPEPKIETSFNVCSDCKSDSKCSNCTQRFIAKHKIPFLDDKRRTFQVLMRDAFIRKDEDLMRRFIHDSLEMNH
ncbi:hypothetical protein QAD02_020635 [Eretmocerus hayati]|uniref:Uncharacterized protein n=1 Tax=Eretmocerus hayati TaxID=131215 RepID=A0ACC2PN66_9HYME|nr:hypothetical protein QAD02_020635 [Eretmocerus hayati]